MTRFAGWKYILREISGRQLARGMPGGQRNYAHAIEKIDPPTSSEPIDLTIELRRGETIRGHVVDEHGEPVDGVLKPCGQAAMRFVDNDGQSVADRYSTIEMVVTPGFLGDYSVARIMGALMPMSTSFPTLIEQTTLYFCRPTNEESSTCQRLSPAQLTALEFREAGGNARRRRFKGRPMKRSIWATSSSSEPNRPLLETATEWSCSPSRFLAEGHVHSPHRT
jgi:hypothetical protein